MAAAAVRTRVSLSLFYDVISPYSYIAFKILQRYQPIWPVDIRLRPVFLGGVLKLAENKPPGYHPLKMKHMMTDLQRQSETYKFPYSSPKDVEEHLFKKGSLKAMRLLTATEHAHPQLLWPLSDHLFARSWGQGLDVSEDASLMAACTAAGVPANVTAELFDAAQGAAVKDALKATSEEVVALGGFGGPIVLVETPDGKKEMYFGSDRFELIAMRIGMPWYGPLANPYLKDLQELLVGKAKL